MIIKEYKLISLEINKAKEAFLKKEKDKLVKHEFSKNSTLNISFSERKGIKFFDKLKNQLLPNLDTVSISGIGDSPSRFANFLTLNFPLRVNNFYAYGSGLNLANYRISDISHILRQRVQRSIRLRDFEMSCYNLEQLLSYCSKMKDIDFSYCKLTDNEEILLDDDFDKLESLNLENIGLSKFNIESIIDYFIFKKIHYRMKYINVYHNNMEDYMEYLLQKIKEKWISWRF